MDVDRENPFDEKDIDDQKMVISGSASLDFAAKQPREKLGLKLKIPISKQGGVVKQHICHVCGKEFSSGKAFGGHVRVHMKGSRHNKKIKNNNKKIGKKKQVAAAVVPVPPPSKGCTTIKAGDLKPCDGKIRCCLCSKDFQSVHSLFGHMRRHPNRGWRGVRPPPPSSEKNSFCSSVSENEFGEKTSNSGPGTDLLKSLPNWSITAKRGKTISDEIPEAAYLLMKLKSGDLRGSSHQSNSFPKKLKLDESGNNSGLITTKSAKEVRKSGNTLCRNLDKGKKKVATSEARITYQEAVSVEGNFFARPRSLIIGPNQTQYEGKFRDFERSRNDEKMVKKVGNKQLKNHSKYSINRSLIAEGKKHLTVNSGNFGMFNQGHKKLLIGPGEAADGSKAMEITSYRGGQIRWTFPALKPQGGYKQLCHRAAPVEPLSQVALLAQANDQNIGPAKSMTGKARCMLDFDLNEPYFELDGEDNRHVSDKGMQLVLLRNLP